MMMGIDERERVLEAWGEVGMAGMEVAGAAVEVGGDGWVAVRAEGGHERAGVTVRAARSWELGEFAEIAVAVRNVGAGNVRVALVVGEAVSEVVGGPALKGAGAGVAKGAGDGVFEGVVSPGEEAVWLVVPLGGAGSGDGAGAWREKFVSMTSKPVDFVRRGVVAGGRVGAVSVFVCGAKGGEVIAVGPVVARGVPAPLAGMSEAEAFPVADGYGQYRHRGWNGKVRNDSDFAERRREEEEDLAAHGRPRGWDRFGGWGDGPAVGASGFFRVEKREGKWWLVDPDGRLFWSHGVVRVGTRIRVGGIYRGTPLAGREYLFTLPAKESALGAFFGTEPRATRGVYLEQDNHAVYDYLEANLFRKYGAGWAAAYAERSHRRLASWGLNTIANSSDPAVYLLRKTPYTAIAYSAPLGRSEFRLAGSKGIWGKLPDPFDPGWRALLDRTLATELKESLGDPWCIGFFVDNELHWGDAYHLAGATLDSPAGQFARRVFLQQLKSRYGDVGSLNAAWGTRFGAWDGLGRPSELGTERIRRDFAAFGACYMEAYFRGCREAIKGASPHHLYLGCRFFGGDNAATMEIAANVCDVVSINCYRRTPGELALPAGCDKPILIGEFHFGPMDSPLHPGGLILAANRTDQARAYETYVRCALAHPAVVGTHWFQLYDEPVTGRFDGENFLCGMLDICDTPYGELVNACRRVGGGMYGMLNAEF